MNRSHFLLVLLGIGVFTAAGAAPPGDLPSCVRGAFVGITETDPNGVILGHPDTRDWGCIGQKNNGGSAGAGATRAFDVPAPLPTAVCFEPAAPNPASGATRLQFALPATAHVGVVIYGRNAGHGSPDVFVARTLVDGIRAPGFYTVTWDLTDEAGARVARGIYRCVLDVGGDVLCGDVEVR